MFRKKKEVEEPVKTAVKAVDRPVMWPSGWFVTTEVATWYIKGNLRLRVYSDRCLASWKAQPALATEKSLAGYKKSGVLGFRDSTLIQDVSDGRMYVVSQSKRRHVVNPDALTILGLKLKDAVVVSAAEAALHKDGEDLGDL
jgi:hypothetical protein